MSKQIAELMMKGKHLVYVDECTFNSWQVPSRSWTRQDTIINMPSNRGKSITIIGAISEKMGGVHFKIFHGSNNTDTFKEFTRDMLKKIHGQATVFMDNLTAHHTLVVKDMFTERVEQRFIPAYSCAMNPIERLWHLVK